jgi:hypothetical protein
MNTLTVAFMGVIPILISTLGIANAQGADYDLLGLGELSVNSRGIILTPTNTSDATNTSDERTNPSSLLNITQTTNMSNITTPNSNMTNKSSNLNTTIPEQLPPESVNGSKSGKI